MNEKMMGGGMMNEGMMENEEGGGTPLDGIIAKVDGYAKNPESVTSETMLELKAELEDLKSVVDGEEPEGERSSLSGTIMNAKGMEGMR